MKGSCLCGAVSFRVTGRPRNTSACHCEQCRRQSGHVWSSAQVDADQFSSTGSVQWYASSASAKRGFCKTCASFLFWKANDEDAISFSLGSIDGPTGLSLEKHIFTGSAGDYYEISDDVPQS
ncbi:MAG: GFA family protein [Boseongicola sp.]|nr:GFA family protein [Boseongicola sp.]